MKDFSLGETNSFCHMRHRAAPYVSLELRGQRLMDCPFLSYRSCCSPPNVWLQACTDLLSFSLWVTHKNTRILPYIHTHSWILHSYKRLKGICKQIRAHSTFFLMFLSHVSTCALRMAMFDSVHFVQIVIVYSWFPEDEPLWIWWSLTFPVAPASGHIPVCSVLGWMIKYLRNHWHLHKPQPYLVLISKC